jgi:hypothetical protein
MVDKSKQGIIIKNGVVYKKHTSLNRANLEKNIARIYSNNNLIPLKTAQYYEPIEENDEVFLPNKMIQGRSLIGNKDYLIRSILVRDLALFHEMFAQNSDNICSSVLYRDAINSNYLMDESNLIHIDFSSSHKFVHAFDDLAMLLNPLWNKITESESREMVNLYLKCRVDFNKSGASAIKQINIKQINNHTPDERKEYYINVISDMASQGMDINNLITKIQSVDFDNLNIKDYDVFSEFRTIRGELYIQKIWSEK